MIDPVARYKDIYLAENPDVRAGDVHFRFVSETITETTRIEYREATPEELAQLQIAQGIHEAEATLRVACRGVSRKEIG